jgi:hypothetical protein
MKIRALHLTHQALDAHEADLERLGRVMVAIGQHFGFFDAFDDGEEWTTARAEERLLRHGPLHPLLHAVSYALRCVRRSHFAAMSHREEALAHLIDLRSTLKGVYREVREYQKNRAEEVEIQRALDAAVGCPTAHTPERERFIAAKFARWRCAMKAAWRETTELAQALQDERLGVVEAGLYEAKGAGIKTEFALRLMEMGMHPNAVAIIRQDYEVSDKTLQSRAQKAEVRQRGDALRREVLRAVGLIQSISQRKSAEAIA